MFPGDGIFPSNAAYSSSAFTIWANSLGPDQSRPFTAGFANFSGGKVPCFFQVGGKKHTLPLKDDIHIVYI